MYPTTINANSAYSFAIIDDNLSIRDGSIVITFPTGLFTLSGISCKNTYNLSQVYSCPVSGGNTVTVAYTRGGSPSPYIYITMDTIVNPPSKQSLTFGYSFISGGTTYRSLSSTIDMLTPDTLTSCSIAFTPATVFTEATVNISITTKNSIDAGGSITVTFPSVWLNSVSTAYPPMIYTTTACTKVTGTALKSTLACDVSGQLIEVRSAFQTTVTPGSVLVFTMTRIRTPPTTTPGNTVDITTQTSIGYLVDSSSCSIGTIVEQPLTLSLTSVTPFVVGAINPLSFSWYTSSPLKVGDTFLISLPPASMLFVSSLINTIRVSYNGRLAGRSISIGNSSQQYRINITSLTPDTEISSGMQIEIVVTVQCLTDISARSVDLQVTRGTSSYIAMGSLGITPTANVLSAVSVNSNLRIVSSPMTLNISFTTNNSLATGSQLKIQVPSTLPLISGSPTPSCTLSSPTLPSAIMATITCTLSSYVLTISSFLQSTLPGGSILILLIANTFKNGDTTEPTSAFVISTYSSNNFLVDQDMSMSYSALPGTISNITILPTSTQVAATTTYTLGYTLTRTIKAGSSIVVKIPP